MSDPLITNSRIDWVPKWCKTRYLDVLGSIYVYNEHRGYTAIDRVIESVQQRSKKDSKLLSNIIKYRSDERKHYLMFRRWFERRGVMPLAVGRTFGHIDRFVEIMFGTPIAKLETQAIVDRDELFERLCRVISLTEKRGFRQVEALLSNRLVRADPSLTRIFKVIHRDEPSHWAPYDNWLKDNAGRAPRWWEIAIDGFIHAELLFLKLPILFINPWTKRCDRWADEELEGKWQTSPAVLREA